MSDRSPVMLPLPFFVCLNSILAFTSFTFFISALVSCSSQIDFVFSNIKYLSAERSPASFRHCSTVVFDRSLPLRRNGRAKGKGHHWCPLHQFLYRLRPSRHRGTNRCTTRQLLNWVPSYRRPQK